MDSVSSRVLLAASGGSSAVWGPAYLHGAVGKVAMIETDDQPATLVAVGENGLLYQRDASGNWQALNLANQGANDGFGDFTDIISNGTVIVATAANTRLGIVASTTLAGLSLYSTFQDNSNMLSVAWSPELELFVATGLNGTRSSENGFTWSDSHYTGPSGNSVVWTGSAFLIAAGNSVYRSMDGATWEQLSTPSLPNGIYIALRYFPLSPSGYVVVLLGHSGGTTGIFSYTSDNGNFWTQNYGLSSAGVLRDINGPGPFSISFPATSDLRVLSDTGRVYTVGGTLVSDVGDIGTTTLYWDNDNGYIVGGGRYSSSSVLKTSPDATGTWQQVSPSPQYTLKALAWDGTRFIAMGYGVAVYASEDGASWTLVDTISVPSLGLNNAVEDLVWTGTFFCGVGVEDSANGLIVRSTDGTTWSAIPGAGDEAYKAVGWSGSVLCAVGESTRIATSNDGLSWAFRTPPGANTSRTLFGVAFGNGTWVAVGQQGKVITAAESGVVWTDRTLGASCDLLSLTFGNGLFVAIGSDRNVYTSPNGITWTARTQPVEAYMPTSVTWAGTQFVAVFEGGQVISSPDGTTWEVVLPRQTTAEAAVKITKRMPLYKVRSGGRTVLAVGAGGSVTRIPRPASPPSPKM